MGFFKWLWATYETLSFFQWLMVLPIGGGGISALPLIGAISGWPLWIQVVTSAGAALVWLTLLTWLIDRFKHKPSTPTASTHGQGASAASQSGVSQAVSGSNNIVAARDIIINIPSGAVLIAQEPRGAASLQPISPSKPLYITCNYRKTAGASGGVYIGLKLNGIAVTELQRVTSTLDQDETGFATWEVGGADAQGARTAIMRWATKDERGQAGGTGRGLDKTVTAVTISGRVDDARITLGTSQLNVYSLP
jgi:hypothetical protein